MKDQNLTESGSSATIDRLEAEPEEVGKAHTDLQTNSSGSEEKVIRPDKFRWSTSDLEDTDMSDNDRLETIMKRLDEISSEHRSDIHRLESTFGDRFSEMRDIFQDLKRDTREDIREIKSSVTGMKGVVEEVKKSNKAIAWAVALAGGSLIIATVWAVYYGTWTIIGTLTSILQVAPKH